MFCQGIVLAPNAGPSCYADRLNDFGGGASTSPALMNDNFSTPSLKARPKRYECSALKGEA
jgi:hypothetical protein